MQLILIYTCKWGMIDLLAKLQHSTGDNTVRGTFSGNLLCWIGVSENNTTPCLLEIQLEFVYSLITHVIENPISKCSNQSSSHS